MANLRLNQNQIDRCRELAEQVSDQVQEVIEQNTSVSIERAVLRLLGVDGAVNRGGQWYPDVNVIIDDLMAAGVLGRGAAYWFVNGIVQTGLSASQLGAAVSSRKIKLTELDLAAEREIRAKAGDLCARSVQVLEERREQRNRNRREIGDPFRPPSPETPLKYVIVATGNIYEDVIQARAAAQAGADAIAVIRSTAQSLLDFVPHGATTEGYGGTYATQENFRIMRAALDEEGKRLGRYLRLTNYCSGLCMAEIAAAAAFERLDFLLNDAMYGILFRDINMKRTLLDQHFSRQILAHAEIMIQTGEDNYLTTADAIENGHQVLASQFINERFAKNAGMPESLVCLGHAQEMNPEHADVFLLEIARAQMTRDIFPASPIKFMPPTRFKSGDIFYSHLMDAMFNFVGVLTRQGVQLLGMPTEAMHTPLMQDRWMSLRNANYIFNGARSLADDIQFKPDGKIQQWADRVLADTVEHLESVVRRGFFKAIEERAFADVSRSENGGKGLDGVITRSPEYLNPFSELLTCPK